MNFVYEEKNDTDFAKLAFIPLMVINVIFATYFFVNEVR
jgi:hypothetical protein